MRAFEAIAEEIARLGVRDVFTYMSRDIIKIVAELSARNITVYQARHEHAALGMADGYARSTGRTGVALVGAGVGLTNAVNALVTAAKAHSRIIVFVGEVPGRGQQTVKYGKYVDQRGFLDALAVRHVDLRTPESTPADVRACFELSARGGEALVVSLPGELLEAESGEAPSNVQLDIPGPATGLSTNDRHTIVEILQESVAAQRTVILAGRGAVAAGARADLMRLGEATGALLATSVMARGLFSDSPYSVGISGTFASPIASELLGSASLVLAFGVSLNYYTTYLGDIFGKAHIVHIDNQPAALGKYQPVDVPVVADARLAAAALADELEQREHHVTGYRSDETAQRIAGFRIEDTFTDHSSASGLDPRTLMTELNRILPPERIVVIDAGNFAAFAVAHLSVADDPRAFIWTVEYNAVGCALGPALGAAAAHPERLTVLCIGDGGMMMSLADLHTAVRYRLPLLIVVNNDSALSGELHFLRESGYSDELARSENPSFEALARSLGLEAATITTIDDLKALRERLRRLRGPMLLDCRITPDIVSGSRDVLRALIRKGIA